MTPAEYGRGLAREHNHTHGPISDAVIEPSARILATVEPEGEAA